MKKHYSKPEIIFDSFKLSESIASGCEYIANSKPNDCAYDTGIGFTIFSDSVSKCGLKTDDGKPYELGQNNMICYDVPTPDSNIFTS